VVFFSAISDEPILVAKNLSAEVNAMGASTSPYKRSSSGDSRESSFGRSIYSFTPPADGKVTIKVRYYDTGTLVEKHCAISTGLSPK
jgi:hypothetical protein